MRSLPISIRYPELCRVSDGAGVPVPSSVMLSGRPAAVCSTDEISAAAAVAAATGATATDAMKSLRSTPNLRAEPTWRRRRLQPVLPLWRRRGVAARRPETSSSKRGVRMAERRAGSAPAKAVEGRRVRPASTTIVDTAASLVG